MMNLKEFSACLIRYSGFILPAFAVAIFLIAGTVMPVSAQHVSGSLSGTETKADVDVETETETEISGQVVIGKPVVGFLLSQIEGLSADLVRSPDNKEMKGISAGISETMYKLRSVGAIGNPGFNRHGVTQYHRSLSMKPGYSGIEFRESLFDTPVVSDTVPHPRSVMFRSLILPGWGQVTNRQIWKVPVVYALLGGLTYYSFYSHNMYSDYRAAYYNIATGNDDFRFGPTPPRLAGVPPESLRDTRNFFRNRRDFTFILIGLAYGLNVLDAYIFAHFRDFDVSEDLSHSSALLPEPFGPPLLSFSYRIRF